METQLQKILVSQQRQKTPLLSQSLDASSPEGRETWMSLGRLLRAEGITPKMIKQNRDILVNAMKLTLHEEPPSSAPESYRTAFESFSEEDASSSRDRRKVEDPRSIISSSTDLFSSAPVRGATFTDAFLRRPTVKAHSLDQQDNLEDGMRSLLQGMGADNVGARDEDEKGPGVPIPRQRKFILKSDKPKIMTVPFDGKGLDPSKLVGSSIRGAIVNEVGARLKIGGKWVVITYYPERLSSDSEIGMNNILRDCLFTSNVRVKEGLLIVNAVVEIFKTPRGDYRMIGLQCDGMAEMSYIVCVHRKEHQSAYMSHLLNSICGDVAISVETV